jgi:23S rRNA (adenine2503-C2)-methyltransferase
MSEANVRSETTPPAPAMPAEVLGMTRAEWKATAQAWGFAEVHASTLWYQLYQAGLREFQTSDRLPPRFVERVLREHRLHFPPVIRETRSSDGFTRKYLLGLPDGEVIETVLMRYSGRTTACVSSQVGCAMGCVFCATGQRGYTRHLTAGEIVGQLLHVDRVLRETAPSPDDPDGTDRPIPALANPRHASVFHRHERLRNVVFMGMGEPLHNYDAVMQAIAILRDSAGLSLGADKITVSTVGVVPGIRRLTAERQPVRLAVSLHGATQAERAALIPVARKWPLDELIDACREHTATLGCRIFFEWTLIDGRNDGPDHAHALGRLLQDIPSQVNLIPLNPTEGYAGLPTGGTAARAFQDILLGYGLPSTVRQRRGIDIAAGCGQLAALSTA